MKNLCNVRVYYDKRLKNSISMEAKQYINKNHSIKEWIKKIEGEYLSLVK